MEDRVEYKYDQSTGIFYKYYYGKVTLQVLTSSWEHAIANNIIPEENLKGFIVDYKNATLKMDTNEASGIADFYNKHLNIFRNMKIALIMEKPDQVIFPILVESKGVNYFPRPFYSHEAALDWILG